MAPMRWLLLLLLTPLALSAHADSEALIRARTAVDVLEALQQSGDSSIPLGLLRKAEGVMIVPNMIKAGFVIGGRHGKGYVAVRQPDGSWSNPLPVKMTGGSFGFQAGVQAADVVLIFRTRRSIEGIVAGKFTLGADASIAAGPLGREANAATDIEFKAEIYAYSRARGLFAGIALDGSAIRIDGKLTEKLYGTDVRPRMVLESRGVNRPDDALVELRDALEEQMAQ